MDPTEDVVPGGAEDTGSSDSGSSDTGAQGADSEADAPAGGGGIEPSEADMPGGTVGSGGTESASDPMPDIAGTGS